jgi:nitroimidazol reductase NimA-like FMN-containing flavoprotein (pyridoxamine 5'-phosphate oxidase superfamily)
VTSRGLDLLGSDECLNLLRTNSFGRVGMKIADDPVILPVFYAMVEDRHHWATSGPRANENASCGSRSTGSPAAA